MSSGVEVAKSVVVPHPSSAGLQSGAIVAGRFRVERLLGEGGMGTVWAARHLVTKKAVALKVLKEPASPELIRRFVREARALSAVRHPNVIEVHDIISLDAGLPGMVLDLLEGETLAARLERTRTLPPRELLELMLPLVSALGAIHRAGIVHRDLKPDNVFLARLGDGRLTPVLLDFGVCKLSNAGAFAESARPTAAGRMMGTPSYMAPEQVRGDVSVDARADAWALGVVMFECLTGQPPFTGDTMADIVRAIAAGPVPRLEAHVPSAPEQLVHLVHRLLLRDRDARLSNLAEAEHLLREARDNPAPLRPSSAPVGAATTAVTVRRPRRPVTLDAPPVMTSVPPPATARRSKNLRVAGAVAATALTAGLLFHVVRFSPTPAAASTSPAPLSPPLVTPAASAAPAVTAPLTTSLAEAPRPVVKAPAKPAARPKLPRPLPDYGGRR